MKRLMRLRANPHLRNMMSEVDFNSAHLIQPLFVVEGLSADEKIPGLKDNNRLTEKSILGQIEKDLKAGVRQFILFPIPAKKTEDNFSRRFDASVITRIKQQFGSDLQLWVDTCLCSSTSHGHCAVMNTKGQIDLGRTLEALAQAALSFAEAGADGISPSDMMDGRTERIRSALDQAGFSNTPIMSYSTKFASHFYGPFRHAANSSPQYGDRKSYQIDVRSREDALASSRRCAKEGADLLMVKPGMTAIDLILPIRKQNGLPVGAYQVSGEYASLCLLAEQNLIQLEPALLETWNVFRRAGAQFIITYGARKAQELGVKIV